MRHDTLTPPSLSAGLRVLTLRHPQGCCTYLLAEPTSGEALVLDVHLDLVEEVVEAIRGEGWKLRYVVDSHTHADHPSGASTLAARLGATRVAHEAGGHSGVSLHPSEGETLALGASQVTVRHAPGHTPDHLVLVTEEALFSGDSLFIGAVARTDFLGGDAGVLYDSLQRILADLSDDTRLYPGHDYEQRGSSTLGEERSSNPWLQLERDAFVRELSANPPPRPANMDDLLRLNREDVAIPDAIEAADAAATVAQGGAGSLIDVRSGVEFDAQHVPGSSWIPLDSLANRLDEVRATPAPRMLLCRTGARARSARELLERHGIGGTSVVLGGILAYQGAGGSVQAGAQRMSIERQVRIGAGSLVLLGLALAQWVHPAFAGLSAFVGAGLVFAGITDWCGMGLLLMKAPWNRKSSSSSSAPVASACSASAPSSCAAGPPSP